jgi:hypothetical protein
MILIFFDEPLVQTQAPPPLSKKCVVTKGKLLKSCTWKLTCGLKRKSQVQYLQLNYQRRNVIYATRLSKCIFQIFVLFFIASFSVGILEASS